MSGPIDYTPRLKDDLELLETAQDGEHRILRGDGSVVRMPNRFVGMMLCFDGDASVRGVAEEASRGGEPVSPALIDKLARQMADIGLVDLVPVVWAMETWDEPRHDCEGCGVSCENHLIGPLSEARVASIEAHHAELARTIPRLAVHPAVIETPYGVYLNRHEGACVFLSPQDRRCELHRHFGADSKPTTCRSFPIAVVQTESTIRVGVQPTCFRMHRVFEDGTALLEGEVMMDELGHRAPSVNVSVPDALGGHARTPLGEERQLLAWLDEEDVTLAEFIARLMGQPPQAPPRAQIPASAARALRAWLEPIAQGQLERLAGQDAPTYLDASLTRLFSQIAALPEVPPVDLSLPAIHQRFVRFGLSQGIYIRETSGLPTPRLGALMLAVGALVATWCAPPAPDAESVDDPFGEAFAGWNRRFVTGVILEELFSGPQDVARLFASWQ